jgi:RimJ/RimL family protein N-acetyltransferase
VNADTLRAVLVDGDLRLEPLAEAHREALRAACAADPDIWDIYSLSFIGEHFDPNFDALLADAGKTMLVASRAGIVIGMSGYLNLAPEHRRLEIGTTYIVPSERGTGTNRAMKTLMIDDAHACGFDRIEFRIDVRNMRSQAAVAKLGATREGVMRHHMLTWTGHVRDTAIFSILRDEWPPAR